MFPAVLSDLLELGKGERRNAVYTRVLWCLSTQQLSLAAWKESTAAVLSRVTVLLASPDSISTSVDTEALNVIKRWLPVCVGMEHDLCVCIRSVLSRVVCAVQWKVYVPVYIPSPGVVVLLLCTFLFLFVPS